MNGTPIRITEERPMPAKYWIKLYIEILNDPKMGRMSDRLYRRTIEMFLLAGDYDDKGRLPPLHDMAWRLQVADEQLETEMIELQRMGILDVVDGEWIVSKFEERQSKMSDAERKRRQRERAKKSEYYEGCHEGVTNRDTEERRQEEIKREDKDKTAADVFTFYEENIGAMTPVLADAIGDAVDEYSAVWVIYAIEQAVKNEARKWAYCQGVLRNLKRDGFNTGHKPSAPANILADMPYLGE
jgi:DnaD/phage-associated family protein